MIPRYKLRLLIESILLESVKREQRYLIEKYPQYASKLGGMQNKWIGWLADRFGTNPTREETASFDEAIKAVEGYPPGAADKYNTNEYFRKLIDAEFPAGDRSWSNLADPTLMTVAEMLKISELNKKKKPRIEVDRTQRVDQYEIARVGPWKISEPPDRESSCNIIGLKPGTDKPRADVCIARTDASNLFYNYAADYTLFTVMRGDNPTEKEILIFGYKDDGTPEFHADPRQNPTVDGNNDALTPAIVERTLGEHHDSIMSIMRNHVLSRSDPSPARQKINSAARSIADYNDVLRGISQAESFSLKQAIASRNEISQEVANRLLAETDEEILKTLASNVGISRETMMQLAQNPNNNVRNAVIHNPNVSGEALDFIARNDPEPVILQQVARRSLASPETLAYLMRNPDEGVQVWAAYNMKTPIESLRRAARRGSSDVRRSVAQNKSADEEILRYLADDPDEQVRDAVIMNPNAPADLIQQVKSGGTMASLRQLIRRMM